MLDLGVEGVVGGVDGGNIVRVSSDSTYTPDLPIQPCIDVEREDVSAPSSEISFEPESGLTSRISAGTYTAANPPRACEVGAPES